MVNGHDGGGFAVEAAGNAVKLGAQLDARHILEPHDRAVRIFAHDDFPKLLLRDQPALGDGGIGVFLAAAGSGGPPICPAGLTVFWLLTAVMTSLAVMFSLAS